MVLFGQPRVVHSISIRILKQVRTNCFVRATRSGIHPKIPISIYNHLRIWSLQEILSTEIGLG